MKELLELELLELESELELLAGWYRSSKGAFDLVAVLFRRSVSAKKGVWP